MSGLTPEEILAQLRRDFPLAVQLCESRVVIARQQDEIRRLKADRPRREPGLRTRELPEAGLKTREFAVGWVPIGRHPN